MYNDFIEPLKIKLEHDIDFISEYTNIIFHKKYNKIMIYGCDIIEIDDTPDDTNIYIYVNFVKNIKILCERVGYGITKEKQYNREGKKYSVDFKTESALLYMYYDMIIETYNNDELNDKLYYSK